MTGDTHKAGGMFVSVVGFYLLKKYNLLLPDVNEGLQWLVMYPFTMWGSIASDLDHNTHAIPSKDIPSRAVNAVLHITEPIKKSFEKNHSEAELKHNIVYKVANTLCAKHRSWQTHSDLTLFLMLYLIYWLMTSSSLGVLDHSFLLLITMGICLGVIAHFILDLITPEGIWLIGLKVLNSVIRLFNPRAKKLPEKLHLVPKSHFFATGGSWEKFVQKVLKVLTWLSIAYLLITLFLPNWLEYIPYTITFNFE